jgi:hypothetical protein
MLMIRSVSNVVSLVLTATLLLLPTHAAFGQSDNTTKPRADGAFAPSDKDLADTRDQLLSLLRMSPTLTLVVTADPTLLADQDYVGRTNPQLEQFLAQHPEVARNPEFYLFANFPEQRGRHVDSLRRRVNGEEPRSQEESQRQYVMTFVQVLIFAAVVGSLLWLVRILLQNRRWGRVFRLQSEVHSKLLDRFATSEELLRYMSTESGRRFLEAAPIPIEFEHDQRLPGGLGRVLAPLQIGIVLTLLGGGLLALQHSLPDISSVLLVFGIVTMMPGIGFIISAVITWRISAQLGLMPQNAVPSAGPANRT